jgi:hypothetical protein
MLPGGRDLARRAVGEPGVGSVVVAVEVVRIVVELRTAIL